MAGITRKQFLERLAAGCLVSAFPLRSPVVDAATTEHAGPLMIPSPTNRWAEASHIVGDRPPLPLDGLRGSAPSFDRTPLYNDFCLVQAEDGRWHCIGILFEGHSEKEFRQDRLFHYIADSVTGPYRSVGYLELGYGKGAGVWAPCIVRDGHRTFMYYAYAGKDHMSIRIAQAQDALLNSWRRGVHGKEILMTEEDDRDPEIIKDKRTGLYLMYYVCSVKSGGDWQGVVRVRTSTDLLRWSTPRTVLGTPPGYAGSESVFVVQRNGYYYMWVSSAADYGVMSLYISTNPFDFGDVVANRIEEQSGHAPEVVWAQGTYWMACVAIASVRRLDTAKQHDLPISQHDLEGVWIQPLKWREAGAEDIAKVSRGHGNELR